MRRLVIVGALLVAGAIPAGAANAVVSKPDAMGCWDRNDFQAAIRMSARGNRAGAVDLIRQMLMSGQCFPVRHGEALVLDEAPWLSGMVKVRRSGERRGFWMNTDLVTVE